MEISSSAVFQKFEEYEAYENLDLVHYSADIVRERFNRGVLNKNMILERYTEQARSSLAKLLHGIEQCFEEASGASGRRLSTKEPDEHAVAVLCRLINFHASFPFPPVWTSGDGAATPVIDKAAFVRALSLLTLHPPPPHTPPLAQQATHGTSTGSDPNALTCTLHFTTKGGKGWSSTPSPCPAQLDDLDWDPEAGQVCYVAHEDERSVDVLDRLMRRPNRDAFEVGPRRTCLGAPLDVGIKDNVSLTWEAFDHSLSVEGHIASVADSLDDKIASLFQH
ncbi:hypothetical protein M406DRAFT_330881 [Cryphonectria parasitica EP155]|uniref:Uncharacterized protein n=1 Tax=Cryphonectria parasitica (strain ATCC 38755 / EP155) TaxID=660469 RepID=A0A9P4Y1A3_CRYP1|nr:uncharacterized protein M406DRAFT_330881 [Cryphonectria parasitica EP155]KAF3764547.1 hypothetical protein M406DRAFT_330881 [Cryphonectria parasitica EP155]